MAKNPIVKILSVLVAALSITSLILLLTTPFLIDNEGGLINKIFYNGIQKSTFGGVTTSYELSDFPASTTVLVLVGIIVIMVGAAYLAILAFTEKNCYITNRRAPGPVTGLFYILGGLLGFIGLMIFVPFALDVFESFDQYSYGIGFIFLLVVYLVALVVGVILLTMTIMNKDKVRRKSRKKRKK